MSSTFPAGATEPSRATHHRFHTLTGVQIAALGSCVPENIVTNEDLGELGYDANWILRRTGIRERRHALPGTATSDLGASAARKCLASAKVPIHDVDLILVATATPDTTMPSTACHIQRILGSTAPAFDMNAACAGFMYGLTTGMQFVKTGNSRNVLVIGAEVMSRFMNPEDRKTYPLFGDGAGAALLTPGGEDQGLIAYTLGANGEGADLLVIPGGGTREPISHQVVDSCRQYLHMDGKSVFKWAVRMIIDSIMNTLDAAQLPSSDLHLVVLHQANTRIIDAAIENLGIDVSKVVINLDRYGNTSAASIPLALDEAHQAGRLRRGDNVLLCGFGAGLTWGCAVMKW